MTTLFFGALVKVIDVEPVATGGLNTEVPSVARYTICARMSGVVPLLPAAAGVKVTLTCVAPVLTVIGMLLRPVYRGS